MTELKFYINKLHNMQYRGDWKESYNHIYKEIHDLIYKSYSLRKNLYLKELEEHNRQMQKLPYIQNDEDKLNFRKIQKHLIDFLHKVKEENKKIFVVYGKDSGLKDKVSSYLGRLKMDYEYLEEGEDAAADYISFHEKAKDCEYAIVLFSADNQVSSQEESPALYRCSQKVIFQLGYFLARNGKKHTIILSIPDKNIELPFDFDGIGISDIDAQGHWKKELVEHMRKSGIYVDEELMVKI
ncbi:MAG: TIR domain-containing protein [Cytophagaceae bacterium]